MPNDTGDIVIKVVDNVDAMLAYWGRDQRCRFANAAYKVWFGKGRHELIGLTMQDLLGPLYEKNRQYIEGALRGEPQVFEREITLPDGSVRHSLASYFPDVVNGEVMGFTVQVADVTRLKNLEFELKAAKAEAEKLATHDFLTGLPNRVLLTDRITAAIQHRARAGGALAVIAIDLDDFKCINDTHGHGFGDAVLKEVAARIKSAIRGIDTLSRLGGDEFILLVTDLNNANELAPMLHRILEVVAHPVEWQGTSLTPGLSGGVAVYPPDARDAEGLLLTADRALYKAKREGKNKFVYAVPFR